MTCGFMNSAGTDLDSLFYTNNGNAGAIGYKTSAGVDLGNRYTNASTLGYSVGYKNSAGTDLGYLRGNLVKPTLNTVTFAHVDSDTHSRFYCSDYDSNTETTDNWIEMRTGQGVVKFTTSLSNSAPVTNLKIYAQHRTATYRSNVNTWVRYYPGQTTFPAACNSAGHQGCCGVTEQGRTDIGVLSDTTYTDYLITTLTYVPTSYTFAYVIAEPDRDVNGDRTVAVRLKLVVTNGAGSNTYYSGEQNLKTKM